MANEELLSLTHTVEILTAYDGKSRKIVEFSNILEDDTDIEKCKTKKVTVNCTNCGAPLTGLNCEYCGTQYR